MTAIGGKRNGREQRNIVGGFQVHAGYVCGCGRHRNSEEIVSEILVIYLKITDPTDEITGREIMTWFWVL